MCAISVLAAGAPGQDQKPRTMKMTATANSFEGETKSGVVNKPGTAADPHIDIYLPSDAAARRFGRREAR